MGSPPDRGRGRGGRGFGRGHGGRGGGRGGHHPQQGGQNNNHGNNFNQGPVSIGLDVAVSNVNCWLMLLHGGTHELLLQLLFFNSCSIIFLV